MSGLAVRNLQVEYGRGRSRLRAVHDVSFDIAPGETLGLVGESGCGKSTVARALCGLERVVGGTVELDGAPLRLGGGSIQMVFQDPYSSLNPRMSVGEAIDEARRLARRSGAEPPSEQDLLGMVALPEQVVHRYPHELSGGQRQRVATARVLALRPRVLVLDEVTASLDVSVQADLLNTLKRLQRELGFSTLFISHDLAVVRYMSRRVMVMYLAKVVERADTVDLVRSPEHPYTKALVASIPGAHTQFAPAMDDMPDPRDPPSGCAFHPRCPAGPRVHADRFVCTEQDPFAIADTRHNSASCFFASSATKENQ